MRDASRTRGGSDGLLLMCIFIFTGELTIDRLKDQRESMEQSHTKVRAGIRGCRIMHADSPRESAPVAKSAARLYSCAFTPLPSSRSHVRVDSTPVEFLEPHTEDSRSRDRRRPTSVFPTVQKLVRASALVRWWRRASARGRRARR